MSQKLHLFTSESIKKKNSVSMETTILNGVGKKMRFGYLNGKYSESMVMASYNRNKKEADNFSVFGYRKYEIEKMLRECFNPLLKIKLQESLENMHRASKLSASQNKTSLEKLEAFKIDACGLGLRKVIKEMKRIVKTTKDKEAKLVLMLLETEFANLSAKQHKGWHKKKIYERKSILMLQMADLLKDLDWTYGINDETGKNANYLVYVYLPNGVQLTWHCNEFHIYECYPPIDAKWDGQVCMTMEKILTYIAKKYMSN